MKRLVIIRLILSSCILSVGYAAETLNQVKDLIQKKDFQDALVIAKQELQLAQNYSDNEPKKADAYYNMGLADFMIGNFNESLEECQKAIELYKFQNPENALGISNSWHLIIGIFLDNKKLPPKEMYKLFEEYSKKVTLIELGLNENTKDEDVYEKLYNNPEIKTAQNNIKKLKESIIKTNRQDALFQNEQDQWESNIYKKCSVAIGLRKQFKNRYDYYNEREQEIRNGSNELKQYILSELNSKIKELQGLDTVLHGDTNAIAGVNHAGSPWSYHFLEEKNSGTPSFLDSRSGELCFCNSDWIVKLSQETGNVGNLKSDLFFYNAHDLSLVGEVRIPNKVFKVEEIRKTGIFCIGTITPAKYRYDDAPLVLTLVDPKNKEIDRIKLVSSDYWFALQNPVSFEVADNEIRVHVDSGNIDKYSCKNSIKPHLSQINICLFPEYSKKSGDNITNTSQEYELKEFSNKVGDLAGLSFIGTFLNIKEKSLVGSDNASVETVINDHSQAIHFVRSSIDGFIYDLDASSLILKSVKVSSGDTIHSPGIFSNGTMRCTINNIPLFIDKNIPIPIKIPPSDISFDISNAFAVPVTTNKYVYQNGISVNPKDIKILKISPKGEVSRMLLPESIISFDASNSIAICPEKNSIFTFSRDYYLTNYFKCFTLTDGRQIGNTIETSTGKSASVGEINIGTSSAGWHIFSVITEFSTGGMGFSIILQNDNQHQQFDIADGLSELCTPLVMKTDHANSVLILYSCAGITKYIRYNLSSKNTTVISQWNSPPSEGNPLILQDRDLVFIPVPSGYEAYRVFGEGKPEKAFEIYFRGSSDYVILLPNGFYAGSPGCEKLIKIPSNGSLVDATSLAPWKNRPAEVIKALGGDPKTADLLGKVTDRWLKRIGFDPSTPEPTASEIAKVSVPQMPPLWATSSSVTFPIEATAGGEPLKEVAVRVNGVLQKSFSGSELNVPKGGHATLNASVTLAEGQNWIEVTATDAKGRPGNLEHFRAILPKASETPKRYIVAIGCSEYDRPELNLQFAAKDAGDVLKTFSEAGGRESKTLLLTNKDVGPEALEKIKAFVGESKESDEVILFCAGHGLLDEHLDYVYAGHQIDPEHPGQTGVKLDALLDAIGSGKSLKRLVLMDTCQSGAVGEKEEMKLAQASTELPHGVRAIKSRALKVVGTTSLAGDDQQRFIEEMFLLPGQHRGINIIGASGGAEYAMESDKWNNGVFTSALIEAMRDKKADMDHRGRISVSDLKTYLAQRVPELTGGAQKPSVVAFEQDQDFDLVGNMPPVPESVKNNLGTTASEVPTPAASGATVSESSSMAQPNLGPQFVNSLGQKFVPIPGTPAYFCIWDTRVSDYGRFAQETGRAWKPAGFPQKPDHPAVRINYNDATAFCEWLTQKEHASGKLPQDCEYRLPKDLEWSAAAGMSPEAPGLPRDRDGAIPNCYAWGTNWPPPPGAGNFDPKLKTDKFPYTSPVGSFAPNKYGLYDISGNVFQWIKEDFDETGLGFLRGGSWPDEEEENLNLSGRCKESKENGYKCYGFRCVIAPIVR